MTKVTLDELPAELAEQIRELRDPIEIVDNEKTIAEIRPVRRGLSYMHIPDPALGPIGQYRPKPLPVPLPVSAVETLLAEREEERNRKKW